MRWDGYELGSLERVSRRTPCFRLAKNVERRHKLGDWPHIALDSESPVPKRPQYDTLGIEIVRFLGCGRKALFCNEISGRLEQKAEGFELFSLRWRVGL